MNILVFNCGSSSLTYKVFRIKNPENIEVILSGKAHRVGVKGSEPSFIEHHFDKRHEKKEIQIANHSDAAILVLDKLKQLNIKIDYIGHRWGHSVGRFKTSFIDEKMLETLKSLIHLLPIHHPAMLSVIYKCRKIYPKIAQYITADCAFHSSIPYHAYTYALPKNIINKFGFRKFGFHGLSYQYVVEEASRFLKIPVKKLKIVACHLGTGGSSVVAVMNGQSIDTSMGYTALPGLMMSTRSGDIDPMLTIYLMNLYGYRPDNLINILNKKSGLLGISGFSSDIRDIIHDISKNKQAKLAFNMYIHALKRYIGSYIVALEGIDVLIFTDDIGVHNWLAREKACENMEWCGILLDKELNRQAVGDKTSLLNTKSSTVRILAIPTEEELAICSEGIKIIGGQI